MSRPRRWKSVWRWCLSVSWNYSTKLCHPCLGKLKLHQQQKRGITKKLLILCGSEVQEASLFTDLEEQLWWVITAVPTQKLYMKDGTSFSVLNLRCLCWPAGGESSGCKVNLGGNEPTVHWWVRGLVTTLIFHTYLLYWYFITEEPEPHVTTCHVNESVGGVTVVTSIFCIQSVLWRGWVGRSSPSDCCDLGP